MSEKVLQVLICDDDQLMVEKMRYLVDAELKKHNLRWTFKTYNDGRKLLKEQNTNKEELIFLDIEMPRISGIEVAEQLMQSGRNRNVVFVTSHENLVFTSLKYFPFSFLRKSKMEQEIQEVVAQYVKKYEEAQKEFEYKVRMNVYRVPLTEIGYLTYFEHKITMTLTDGDKKEFRGTIKECEQKLISSHFYKANGGTVVNLRFCEMLEQNCFIMKDGSRIPVSREKKKEAKQRFLRSRRENT